MNKQRASGRKDGYARISGLADICERPHMSTEQRKAAEAAAAGRGTNVWSIVGAPERGAMRSLFIHVCGHPPMATSMSETEGSYDHADQTAPAQNSPAPDTGGIFDRCRNQS